MSFIWPVSGSVISPFGVARDGGARSHEGIDISASRGQAIYAAAAGRVFKAGWISNSAGRGVEIDHGGGWISKYFHLEQVFANVGQQVARGARIGTAGNTGNAANTATHLHFELWQGGRAVNPLPLLQGGGTLAGLSANKLPLLLALLFVVVIARH